jgi:hypothetical protein
VQFTGIVGLRTPHRLHVLGRPDALMRNPTIGNSEQQGNRTMTKNFAFAASIAVLMMISGQALAETATSNAWYEPEAAGPAARQAVYGVNAFDRTMATETGTHNAYQYHGGPKSND